MYLRNATSVHIRRGFLCTRVEVLGEVDACEGERGFFGCGARARGIQWRISDSRKTVNSMNKRKYESSAKGYVLQLENAFIETVQHSNTCKAQQLTQPMVCAQIYVEKPEDKFTIEFVFSEVETRRDRRRVVLSNAFMETKTSPLHCQVPLSRRGERRKVEKRNQSQRTRLLVIRRKNTKMRAILREDREILLERLRTVRG